jgi:shikimate kinase
VNPQVRSIVLIGMMGAGKSSVGRCLERRAGLKRYELDDIVSQHFSKSIVEIFAEHGQEEFRRVETEALAALNPDRPAIIVTGGGVILRDENVRHLKRLGTVVWLDADADTLFQRASRRGNRPLLQTSDPRSTVGSILSERTPLYASAADIRVDTTNLTHDEVAEAILVQVEAIPGTAT